MLLSTKHHWLHIFQDQISLPLGFFRLFSVQGGRCSHAVEDGNVIWEELYDLVGIKKNRWEPSSAGYKSIHM